MENKDISAQGIKKTSDTRPDVKDIKGTDRSSDRSADSSRDYSASKDRKDIGDVEMDESKSTDDFGTDSPLRGRQTPDTINPQAKSDKNWQDKNH